MQQKQQQQAGSSSSSSSRMATPRVLAEASAAAQGERDAFLGSVIMQRDQSRHWLERGWIAIGSRSLDDLLQCSSGPQSTPQHCFPLLAPPLCVFAVLYALKTQVPTTNNTHHIITAGAAPTAAAAANAAVSAAAPPPLPAIDSFEAFAAAAATGANVVPLYRRLLSDQLTPVMAYRCLVKEADVEAPSFLLESVVNGDQQGRYSFVGALPALEVVATQRRVTVLNHAEGTRRVTDEADPMDVSASALLVLSYNCWQCRVGSFDPKGGRQGEQSCCCLFTLHFTHQSPQTPAPYTNQQTNKTTQVPVQLSRNWRPARVDGLPAVFTGGWVGYAGYDTVRYVYGAKIPFESAPEDDRRLPDLHLALYNDVVVLDQATKLIYAISWVHLDDLDQVNRQQQQQQGQQQQAQRRDEAALRRAYEAGAARLARLVGLLQSPPAPLAQGAVDLSLAQFPGSPGRSNMTEAGFMGAIARAKEYILVGFWVSWRWGLAGQRAVAFGGRGLAGR